MRFTTLIFALLFPMAALAGQLEDGNAAFDRHEYALSLSLLRPIAEDGNPEAQEKLGEIYYLGQGVPKDVLLAAVWFRKAAQQGNARAQMRLGDLYLRDEKYFRNYDEALTWLNKSADQGYMDAILELANIYEKGEGPIPQENDTAYNLYAQALARSHGDKRVIDQRNKFLAHLSKQQLSDIENTSATARNNQGVTCIEHYGFTNDGHPFLSPHVEIMLNELNKTVTIKIKNETKSDLNYGDLIDSVGDPFKDERENISFIIRDKEFKIATLFKYNGVLLNAEGYISQYLFVALSNDDPQPIHMSILHPGEEITRTAMVSNLFSTKDHWEIPTQNLDRSNIKFKYKVFMDENRIGYLECQTPWYQVEDKRFYQ